jgi:hypothetical protein
MQQTILRCPSTYLQTAKLLLSAWQALRTLKLLEQHHQKLAELLKFRPQDVPTSTAVITTTDSLPEAVVPPAPPLAKALESSPRHISQHSPRVLPPPHRDLSSSIASNLASARGIPSNRQRRGLQIPAALSPQLAEGKLVNPTSKSRLSTHEIKAEDVQEVAPKTRSSALSPTRATISAADVNSTSPEGQNSTQQPAPDDSFSRFYATFEGLLSKLSAPLAFAGLPLIPSDPSPAPSMLSEKKPQPNSPSKIDSDISRLFSRAALRAVREEHGFPNAAESFYVVPTTGGTMSYANMLSSTRQHHPSHTLPFVDEDEQFVDASETPQHEHSHQRQRRLAQKSSSGKTLEELTVENDTLKAVAIDLGDRLRAFEMGAQRSSMALHMSMRAIQSPSASAAHVSNAKNDSEQEARIKELEEEVRGVRKEMKRLVRENQKLQGVVDRYRERWEILKDGARERLRDGKGGDGRERS